MADERMVLRPIESWLGASMDDLLLTLGPPDRREPGQRWLHPEGRRVMVQTDAGAVEEPLELGPAPERLLPLAPYVAWRYERVVREEGEEAWLFYVADPAHVLPPAVVEGDEPIESLMHIDAEVRPTPPVDSTCSLDLPGESLPEYHRPPPRRWPLPPASGRLCVVQVVRADTVMEW